MGIPEPREGSILRALVTGQGTGLIVEGAPPRPDADRVVELLAGAVEAVDSDETAVLSAWDEAGGMHDPEALDHALTRLAPWRGLGVLRFGYRRRLLATARLALAATARAGTIRLAVAFLGALGDSKDVPAMEAAASHPLFTLHGATALSNHPHHTSVAALLRVLVRTDGQAREVVIDRLLPHCREPAVRLALLRDALTGLTDEAARDLAPELADACRAREILEDPKADPELREAAGRLLHLIR